MNEVEHVVGELRPQAPERDGGAGDVPLAEFVLAGLLEDRAARQHLVEQAAQAV
jgi:hypothetical protein